MNPVKVSIIGATGYAGAELLRILLNHPNAEVAAISSVSFEGKPVNTVYPAFNQICEMVCVNADTAIKAGDVIFACLPHGLSQELAGQCKAYNKMFIDLGADFRLESELDYKEWYGGGFSDAELHKEAVYGLPELNRNLIRSAKILANPGCYPTASALALIPALKEQLIETCGIIIDAKSGVTGAGRTLSQATHFSDVNEAFAPYKIAAHRHMPEIEQSLTNASGTPVKLTFVPHLLPVNRGIISTCYAKLKDDVSEDMIRKAYLTYYQNEPFVRFFPQGETVNIKHVQYSNYCDISLHVDAHTNTLIAVSAIDNMVKGAAGQAVQNMNIMMGLPEREGLNFIPLSF